MTSYEYGKSPEGKVRRRMEERKAMIVAADARARNVEAAHRSRRYARMLEANQRPVEDVHAEAEHIRREAVANMTIGYYEEGTARLRAATEEMDQRRMARYMETAQRNRTNQGCEAA